MQLQRAAPSARSHSLRRSSRPLKVLSPRISRNGPVSCASSQPAASLRKRSSAGLKPSLMSSPVTLSEKRRRYGAAADARREALALPGGCPEERRAGAGTLEIQLHVVLPGEADAPVQLQGVGRTSEVRLAAVALGDGRSFGEFLGTLV